ncbi:MAG: RNA methyltransferase TrmH [Gallionellaceae bacterium]|nr:MAG: RNA methyltransferase TrmH [Gallionellaceae bacterium]
MSATKRITSRDNSFFKELSKLAGSSRQRRKAGQTLLDGAHLVQAYLLSGKRPLHLLVNAASAQDIEISSLIARLADVPLTSLDDALFGELTELKTPSGLLALIELPQPHVSPSHSRFCILLEDIQDPGNLGSILRTAAAAGCDAAFLSTGCTDVWSPKVLRAAMGGHFLLSIHEHADLFNVAAVFEGAIFATSLQATTSLYDSKLTGSIAFAFGNEGAGLSLDMLDVVRHKIIIPMPGKVESLNVAAAAAVCLFEAVRQRI